MWFVGLNRFEEANRWAPCSHRVKPLGGNTQSRLQAHPWACGNQAITSSWQARNWTGLAPTAILFPFNQWKIVLILTKKFCICSVTLRGELKCGSTCSLKTWRHLAQPSTSHQENQRSTFVVCLWADIFFLMPANLTLWHASLISCPCP